MSNLVQFNVDGDQALIVEVARRGYEDEPVGAPRVAQVATKTLNAALAVVRPATKALLDAVGELDVQEVQVEFGVALDGEVGAFVAKSTASGHFQVTLTCRPTSKPAEQRP